MGSQRSKYTRWGNVADLADRVGGGEGLICVNSYFPFRSTFTLADISS
jgi:hypothetical protein